MYDMKNIEDNYDKTFVLYVLEKLNITPYQLSKLTGISDRTFTSVKRFKANLSWKLIRKIEESTDIKFKSDEHIFYSTKFHDDNPDLFKEN